MATFYISPNGDDARTSVQAQVEATPWLTLQKAWEHIATLGTGQIIDVLDGTWDGPDAKFHSRGADQTGTIYTPTVPTIRVRSGNNPIFRIPTGTGVQGMPTNRGQIWKFESQTDLTFDVLAGGSLTLGDYEDATNTYPVAGTEPVADGGQGKYTSALYLVSCTRATIRGKFKVSAYNGNGVMFHNSIGPLIEPDASGNSADVQECMTGVTFENCTGARASTTLSATASIGATTITVTSAASFPVGSYINIGTGQGLVSWRRVSAVNGNILTIGEGPYFSFPLEKSHASGSTVRRMGGLVGSLTDRAYMHGMHRPLRNTPTGGNDAGAMCTSIQENCTDIVMARTELADAWCYSYDYGVDGGGNNFHSNMADSRCYFTEQLIHDVHSPFELGTNELLDGGGNPIPNPNNGNWRYSFNKVYGQTDRQYENTNPAIGGGLAPGAPLMLARANPYLEIEFNTYRPTNGNLNNGGLQISASGGYTGTNNNMTIRSNLFEMAYSSPALCILLGADPTALTWNYNLIYHSGTTDNAVDRNYGSPADFASTSAGLTSFRSATTWGDNDQWNVNPLLVLDGTQPTYLSSGSPALNASHKGSGYAIGGLELQSSATTNAAAGNAAGTGISRAITGKVALVAPLSVATGAANSASGRISGVASLTIRMG